MVCYCYDLGEAEMMGRGYYFFFLLYHMIVGV